MVMLHLATDLVTIGVLLTLYSFLVGFFGLFRHRSAPAAVPGRLLVVIPAHNEQAVIADVLRSLQASDYPRERLHLLVLADHCSDWTVARAVAAGADEIAQRRSGRGGKQFALGWLLHEYFSPADLRHWDGVVVVDADNLVHPRMLRGLSDELAAGAAAVQAALDTRNPESSWISRAYAAAYWVANLSVQRSRMRLGLSAQLGGTGCAIATWALEQIPFRPVTLVDDLEYTLQLIMAGYRVRYCEHPTYDEKPITLAASIRQRTRWMRGQAQLIIRLGPDLAARALLARDLVALDQWLMLWNPVAIVLTCAFFLAVLPQQGLGGLLVWAVVNGLWNGAFLWRARIPARLAAANLAAAMVYSFTWIWPVLSGFLTCTRTGWDHTTHVGAGMAPPALPAREGVIA